MIKKSVFIGLVLGISQWTAAANGLFNVTATGPNITISSNIPNHHYPFAGIKINTKGFNILNSEACSISSNGYCVFSINDKIPTTIPITGFGNFDLTLCLNAIGQVSCQRYIVSGERFSYITSGSESTSTVSLCDVNNATGHMSNCNVVGSGFLSPLLAAVNNKGNRVYVTNWSDGSPVSLCQMNNAGALLNCVDTGSATKTKFLVLNTSETVAYMTSGDIVTACSVNNSGELTDCFVTGSGFSGAGGLAFTPNYNQIYVTNFINNNVSLCSINKTTNALENCQVSGSGFARPWRITLEKNGTYAYLTTDTTSDVILCSIEKNTGVLVNCTNTASNTFGGAGNIAINSSNSIAYVPNSNTETVSMCMINISNGELFNCSDSGATVIDPVGITLF